MPVGYCALQNQVFCGAGISQPSHWQRLRPMIASRSSAVDTTLSRSRIATGSVTRASTYCATPAAPSSNATAADDHQLALDLGRKVLSEAPDAQALLMPGGLWFAIHAVPILEAEFGKPVLLNILSTTWAALHSAKNVPHRPDPKWGKVLQNF